MIGYLCGPMLVFLLLSVLLWRRHTFVAAEEPEPAKLMDKNAVDDSTPLIDRAAAPFLSQAPQRQPTVAGIDRKRLMGLPFLRQVLSAEFLCFVVFLDLALLRVRKGANEKGRNIRLATRCFYNLLLADCVLFELCVAAA